jgi:hypothetical protein
MRRLHHLESKDPEKASRADAAYLFLPRHDLLSRAPA